MLRAVMGKIESVLVIGTGKVGSLVATLLHESGFRVEAADAVPRTDLPTPCRALEVKDPHQLVEAMKDRDAVVSCLPYDLNLPVARAAHWP
jgi:saccharopine dehydrogenase (NAD+, L-lysine-forming)